MLQVQKGGTQEVGVSEDEEGDENGRESGTATQCMEKGEGTL